jgi:hypothetical protein
LISPPGITIKCEISCLAEPGGQREDNFYDLGKDDPVTCIECSHTWHPEPVLKSKQPVAFEEIKKKVVEEREDHDLAEDDLDIDDDGDSPDNDVDLGGDDDLGVVHSDDDKDDS